MEIYLQQNAERSGPYTLENLQVWLEDGQLSVSDAAWFEGCSDWVKVQDVPGIMLPGGDHLLNVSTVPPFEAYHGNEPYVFTSYAHKDAAVVYEEIGRLHEAGINIWYDEGIEASNEWPEEIARAVVDCTVFLAFISPRSTNSVNCRNEINMALNENKPFLAIHLEETELPLGLRLRMGDLQAILRHKLPVDRYQKKTQGSLEQLLGKKPARSRTRPSVAPQTEAAHEPAEQAVLADAATSSPKPRRTALVVALASVLLIACSALGLLFFGDDGDRTEATKEPLEPDPIVATFTPGQPWTVPSVDLEMLWCEPGTFMMGSPPSEDGRSVTWDGRKVRPENWNEVNLSEGFYLGLHEVTQSEWKKVMKSSPSQFSGERRPVERVSWKVIQTFLSRLNEMEAATGHLPEGWEYSLPTEAQWEYACRAGSTTPFSFGESLASTQANFDGRKPYGAGASGPFLKETSNVGSYPPNAWGFYDMHGNVWEWCNDKLTDFGSESAINRIVRGGSWINSGLHLRCAYRYDYAPGRLYAHLGFRLCLRQRK